VDARLASEIASLLAQAERLGQMEVGVVVAAEFDTGAGDTPVGVRLTVAVTDAPRGGQTSALRGIPVVPVPPAIEVRLHRPGQLPGAAVKAVVESLIDHRREHLVLVVEPGERLRVTREAFWLRTWLRHINGDRLAHGIKQPVGGVGCMQVVVKHAVDRGPANSFIVGGFGLLGGIGAQQIMEDETAGNALDQHVRACQLGQCRACQAGGDSGEAGRGVGRDVRAGVKT
jgi:hypothetical protein